MGLGVSVWRLLFDCLSCLLMKSMALQRILLNRLCYQQASFHPRKHIAKVLQRKHRGCHRRVISSQHLFLLSFKLMSHLQLHPDNNSDQSLRQDLKFHPRHMEPCQYPSGKFSCYPSDTQMIKLGLHLLLWSMLSDQRGSFHLHKLHLSTIIRSGLKWLLDLDFGSSSLLPCSLSCSHLGTRC